MIPVFLLNVKSWARSIVPYHKLLTAKWTNVSFECDRYWRQVRWPFTQNVLFDGSPLAIHKPVSCVQVEDQSVNVSSFFSTVDTIACNHHVQILMVLLDESAGLAPALAHRRGPPSHWPLCVCLPLSFITTRLTSSFCFCPFVFLSGTVHSSYLFLSGQTLHISTSGNVQEGGHSGPAELYSAACRLGGM